MSNPLADINNIAFFDTETKADAGATPSDANIKTAGTYRYAKNAFVIIGTFAIAEEPVWERSLKRFDGDWLCWADMPERLREFHKRVEQREAWYAAFNAGFDRQAWNEGTYDFPRLEADMVIDVAAQTGASNLPPNLEGVSRAVTGRGKQDDGKALINLFTRPDSPQPFERPEEWARFVSYAIRDTAEMREAWRATRPLPFEEWEDYWVSERINERGVKLDLEFAALAAATADAEVARINRELVRWTNGQITAITQAKRICDWVYDRLESSEARGILVKEWETEDAEADELGEGGGLKVGKLSLDRGRIEALIAYFDAQRDEEGHLPPAEQLIVDVVTARQFGGSSSPQKFHKMLAQHDGGRLKGQYVFNGAQQTGRFSSKSVQVHNLTRGSLGSHEEETIEFINDLP